MLFSGIPTVIIQEANLFCKEPRAFRPGRQGLPFDQTRERKRMKRTFALLLGICLLFALAGCGDAPGGSSAQSGGGSSAQSGGVSSDASGASASAAGTTDGFLGDTMSTAFFDFSVNSAEICETCDGCTATDGNQLVVVTLSVKNTSTYSMPMLSDDFQIQWGDGDEDYGFPVGGSLCKDFDIPINGSQEGDLVFEVPEDTKDYSIAFQEYFDDDTEGNTYFVYFTATADSAAAA
jgi:hypothetical protein